MVMLVALALLAIQLSSVFWQIFPAPNMGDNAFQSQIVRGDTPATPQQTYLEKAQLIGRLLQCGLNTV